MTREDSIKLLALIKVAYPSSYKDMDSESLEATVKMWQMSFSDVPYVLMEMAFNRFRMKSKFSPTVADFREGLGDLYWDACGRIVDPFLTLDAARRCEFVMEYTGRFRGDDDDFCIDYAAITNDMLSAPEYLLLKEG